MKNSSSKRLAAAQRRQEARRGSEDMRDVMDSVRGMNLASQMKSWALVDIREEVDGSE